MNYIEIINNFWKVDEEYSFTPNEVAVFFRLLNKCNSVSWKNPFNFLSDRLMLDVKCKKDAFDTARNRLKQSGVIDYRNGNGRGLATIYEIRVQKKPPLKQHPFPAPFPAPLTYPLPPYNNKQKLNLNKTSSIKIEDWGSKKNEIKNSSQWVEVVCRQFNVSQEEIFKELEEFFTYIETQERQENSIKELKQYFVNRFKKEKEKNSEKKESHGNYKASGQQSRENRIQSTDNMANLATEVLRNLAS